MHAGAGTVACASFGWMVMEVAGEICRQVVPGLQL
jgi:hypothetical protein